jgi:hypothetical protein
VSPDIRHLFHIAQKMGETRLALTLRSARETFRESLSGFLLAWIKSLPTIMGMQARKAKVASEYESVEAVCRRLICLEMIRERRHMRHFFVANSSPLDYSQDEDYIELEKIEKADWGNYSWLN